MAKYFETFSKFGLEPYKRDPGLKIVEGKIQILNKEIARNLEALLVDAAIEAENYMKGAAPKKTGRLAESISIYPNTQQMEAGARLPVTRGGFAPGLPQAGRGRGPGGASRKIEIRVTAPYAQLVVEGQPMQKAPEGKYFVFYPYDRKNPQSRARDKIFEKNRKYADTRTNLYQREPYVVFATARNAIKPNRAWLDDGVRVANRHISDRISKLL